VAVAIDHAEVIAEPGSVLVVVQATIDNRTGVQLAVRSNFASPFDGLVRVMERLPEGVEVARQVYNSEGRLFLRSCR
jgi:hypothetical protein